MTPNINMNITGTPNTMTFGEGEINEVTPPTPDALPKLMMSKSAHCISNSASQIVTINGVRTLRRSFRENRRMSKLRYIPPTTPKTPHHLNGNINNNIKGDSGKSEDVYNSDIEMEFDLEMSPSLKENIKNMEISVNHSLQPPLELKHNKSNSMPMDIDEYIFDHGKVNMEEILRSFNILSKYGFCDIVKK